MKCLLFFTLMGVLTSYTEGCMPSDASNANHKSDKNGDAVDYDVTTVKSVPIDAHTFSIIPAKSVVVIVSTEKPTTAEPVTETIMNKMAAPETIHSSPLSATIYISSSNTDHSIQSMNAVTTKPTTSANTTETATQKPALVFAETPNKVVPIVITAQIITATPMVEEVSSMKPSAIHSLNATSSEKPSVNVTVETVSKTAVVTTVVTTATTTAIEHSTEKPAVPVVPEMTKLTTAATVMNSTEKPAVHVVPEMTNLTTAASTAEHSTEKLAVIHIVSEMTNVTTASANAVEHSTEHSATVHVVPEMTNLTTAAMNSTEKPAHVKAEMIPSATAIPAISTEKSTHVTEAMDKTVEATTIKTNSSMLTVVTAAPMKIQREKRQAPGTITTKKPEMTTKMSDIHTTKNPSVATTHVFGTRFPTRAPIPMTHRIRSNSTLRRNSTAHPSTTRQPIHHLSPMPVHTPVTMKPHPVTTGSVTPKV